jgi:hypothetical protein
MVISLDSLPGVFPAVSARIRSTMEASDESARDGGSPSRMASLAANDAAGSLSVALGNKNNFG